jgi:hypothetical protein
MILQKLPNPNGIFFDLIERLITCKSQSHKKIFKTVEGFIKDMKVTEILQELLKRLEISQEIHEYSLDTSEKLTQLCQPSKKVDKAKLWIIVGTLQIISKRLQRVEKQDRFECLKYLLLLGSIGQSLKDTNEREMSCYYKLLLGLVRETSKDVQFDELLEDPRILVKFWFSILSQTTDSELYSINLKFIEKVLLNSNNNKSKAHNVVHQILVWFSELSGDKGEFDRLNGTIFEGLYQSNPEMFSAHYCQSIDLFLASFKSDSDDPDSSKLVN